MLQYKKKGFLLRFTLFVYLTTSKICLFRSITTYNIEFQITFNKLVNTGSTFSNDLPLVIYWHGIEDTYPYFATSQQSAAQAHILDISILISQLEDEACTLNQLTASPTYYSNTSRRKSYSVNTINLGYSSYPSE